MKDVFKQSILDNDMACNKYEEDGFDGHYHNWSSKLELVIIITMYLT